MKISYLMYEPVPDFAELTRRLERLAALGYHGVELVATAPLGYALDDLVALSRRLDLPVVSLLSGWSYANEQLCLSSPDRTVRTWAVARLCDYVAAASQLGALVVVGLMQGLRGDEADEHKANERIVDCLRQVGQAAESAGVTVALEPVNHLQVGFNNSVAEARAVCERVGSKAVGFMLDTIHMNIEERSLLGAIREQGGVARHFHLCDSNGGPFGGGNLDFAAVLQAIDASGYRGCVSTKVYRKATWEEAAVGCAEFLQRHGVVFRRR